MIFQLVIVIISFLLDGILSNYLSYMMNDLSLFTPYFTLISIIIIYPFFMKEEKNYYILIGITGFLYDLFYTNLLFTHTIFFLLIGLIVSFIYKKMELNLLTNFFLSILVLVIYHSIFALSLFIFNVVPVSLESTVYLITHSLILNIIYAEILYLICKYLPHKRHLN